MSIDPRKFPDFTDSKIVDRHMGKLDTHGVSRREFLAFASAAAIATTAAGALGYPNVALASTSGKRPIRRSHGGSNTRSARMSALWRRPKRSGFRTRRSMANLIR